MNRFILLAVCSLVAVAASITSKPTTDVQDQSDQTLFRSVAVAAITSNSAKGKVTENDHDFSLPPIDGATLFRSNEPSTKAVLATPTSDGHPHQSTGGRWEKPENQAPIPVFMAVRPVHEVLQNVYEPLRPDYKPPKSDSKPAPEPDGLALEPPKPPYDDPRPNYSAFRPPKFSDEPFRPITRPDDGDRQVINRVPKYWPPPSTISKKIRPPDHPLPPGAPYDAPGASQGHKSAPAKTLFYEASPVASAYRENKFFESAKDAYVDSRAPYETLSAYRSLEGAPFPAPAAPVNEAPKPFYDPVLPSLSVAPVPQPNPPTEQSKAPSFQIAPVSVAPAPVFEEPKPSFLPSPSPPALEEVKSSHQPPLVAPVEPSPSYLPPAPFYGEIKPSNIPPPPAAPVRPNPFYIPPTPIKPSPTPDYEGPKLPPAAPVAPNPSYLQSDPTPLSTPQIPAPATPVTEPQIQAPVPPVTVAPAVPNPSYIPPAPLNAPQLPVPTPPVTSYLPPAAPAVPNPYLPPAPIPLNVPQLPAPGYGPPPAPGYEPSPSPAPGYGPPPAPVAPTPPAYSPPAPAYGVPLSLAPAAPAQPLPVAPALSYAPPAPVVPYHPSPAYGYGLPVLHESHYSIPPAYYSAYLPAYPPSPAPYRRPYHFHKHHRPLFFKKPKKHYGYHYHRPYPAKHVHSFHLKPSYAAPYGHHPAPDYGSVGAGYGR